MIFGVTRYSVFIPGAKSWRASGMSEADYRSHLYDPQRMKIKEKIFEDYSLPLILTNLENNRNYYHFMEYSEELPRQYKDKLFEMCESHDRIVMIKHGEEGGRIDKIKEIVKRHAEKKSLSYCVFGTFKLDDDDLISIDFVSRVNNYLEKRFVGFAISFGKGVIGHFDPEFNDYISFKEVYQPKVNIGLTTIGSAEIVDGRLVGFRLTSPGSHMSVDERLPLILDSREKIFLWTKSGVQDTAVGKVNFKDKFSKRLSSLPDVDIDFLSEKFLIR